MLSSRPEPRLNSLNTPFFVSNIAGRVVSEVRVEAVFGVTVELLKNCIELLSEADKVERVSAS